MITKMKKYTFLVFHREYDRFLERLREAGVLHVAEKAEGMADNEALQERINLSQRLQKTIAAVSACLPEGAVPVGVNAHATDAETLIQDFENLQSEKRQLEQTFLSIEKEAERMAIWGDFSYQKLTDLHKEGWYLRCFVCSADKYNAEWETLYNACPVAKESSMVYFAIVTPSDRIPDFDATEVQLNEHNTQQLRADAEALRGLLVAKQAQIEAWAIAHLGELQALLKDTLRAVDWKRVGLSTTPLADDTLCLLEGFCPADNTEALNCMLNEEHVFYTVDDPSATDDTPVKLRNNRFTRLFECLTGMYGWPVYGEFDPTPILAPFFLLFFALCMGDAGYGVLLILFGILTSKKILRISMFDGLGPLITVLGVGTTVVGFFLGTCFGVDMTELTWMPASLKSVMLKGELMGYDLQMVLALCIGVFHICLAMVVKAVCYTMRFGFRQNVSLWGWLFLILGGLVTGALMLLEVFPIEVAKWVFIAIGVVSALGIYIFNTPGRNPLVNIGAGLWDTYNMATGILGDVLSYIRLYALGLAGGMLGGAFNTLGAMALGDKTGIGSWIAFVLIILLGHLLNLCMSALGAFVHPLRLSFVEYFKNAGYEGKGRLYAPFADK